jgi:UDP-glucose 4-epimerase
MEDIKVVLITGVAGLLGANFSRHLLSNYPHLIVIGIDNFTGGYIEHVPITSNRFILYPFDLLNTNMVNTIFNLHKIDLIYHFAAYAAEGLSPFIRVHNYNNNLVATANLINKAIQYKIKRFVFTSSMAVYGNGGDNPPFDEKLDMKPIDPYGIAKMACELDLHVAGDQHGLDWCIIRPHNVYGTYQNIWDSYRNVIGIWMQQILSGKAITIYGDGLQERAFTYIDDIMQPLVEAGISPTASKQTINLGGMNPITIKDLAELVQNITDDANPIRYCEKRHEVKYAWPTYQKSIELLYYTENYTLYDGIKKMWEWAKNQPNRPLQKWNTFEITDKIYSYWK